MQTKELLMVLLGTVVCGRPVEQELTAACTPEALQQVYKLAFRHDVAHLVGQAVSEFNLEESESLTECRQAALQAVCRYLRSDYECRQICETLEAAKIQFIPLKGSVLRDYYPEAWMRTSCDLDILVHPEELDTAADLLVKTLGYDRREKGNHDLAMFSPSGLCLELHYNVIEKGIFPRAQDILGNIWQYAQPKNPGGCHLELTDEMFYFYHIFHMAKHVENGGCGIRTFLDLWLLNHRKNYDSQRFGEILKAGGLLEFSQAVEKLTAVWFSGAQTDPMTQKLEQFILDGGVFGSVDNRVAVSQIKEGSKIKYFLSKLFLKYDTIKYYYPVLQKHRWLTPLYQVVRWCRLIFTPAAKLTAQKMKTNAARSQDEIVATEELLNYLGL